MCPNLQTQPGFCYQTSSNGGLWQRVHPVNVTENGNIHILIYNL